MDKIGIGITTHNRYELFHTAYYYWLKHMPVGAKLVIVDDASETPIPDATYRFKKQQGIAKAKNKCLELLSDCDYIFLADDDVWPITDDWYQPYINTGLNHLCLSFELNSRGFRLSNTVFVRDKKKDYWVYNAPNGCLLFLTKECIESVGGYDPKFKIWGGEHQQYSQRIHNAGLTPYPFMDVPDSLKYFHVCDYYGEIKSSVPQATRIECINHNMKFVEQDKQSKQFIPLK